MYPKSMDVLTPDHKRTNVRWQVVGLLFFATTINYIDRQVIGLLKPYIEKDLGWTDADYGYIVTAFQCAYAVGFIISGRLLDKFGTRLGYSLAITLWSLAATLHALGNSVMSFSIVRALLGLGEAANFPAAIKTVAEWFPKRDRALATGLFNSGANVGAIVAPLIVAGLTVAWGWKMAFVVTGLMGFTWLVFWWLIYRSPQAHRGVSEAELQYITSDEPEKTHVASGKSVQWTALFRHRETYVICLVRFITDWVWWFFLFWMPDFLNKTQHVDIKQAAFPLLIIYSVAGLGSIGGGAMSSWLIKSGKTVGYARKAALLVCSLAVLPLGWMASGHGLTTIVVVMSLAAAAHQGWASNVYSLVSDLYPKNLVATVTGLCGFAGAIGGAFSASFVGLALEWSGSYVLIFTTASLMYLAAWFVLLVFLPDLRPVRLRD